MLKKIGLVFVVLLAVLVGFLAFAASRDGKYHVERSATIAAPPDKIYAILSDLRRFGEWSPWEKLDPNMKRTVDEKTYYWNGNDKAGEGRMTIENTVPNQSVQVKLEFIKPFASQCTVVWSLKPEGDKTTVTWAMDGESKSLVEKTFSLFGDMDKMIGPDFEKGLTNLQQVAEKK